MRIRSFVPLLATLVLVARAALVVPAAEAATSGPVATIPLPSGFGAIEVDGLTQRVFVSSTTSSVVTVLADTGRSLGTLKVPGAGRLLIDGGKVYVASTTAGRIDVFDTATLQLVGSYGGGSLLKPLAVVKAAGRLWTTSGNCGSFSLRLVSIDLTSGAMTTHQPVTSLGYCPFLFTSPTDPNLVLGFDRGLSPTTIVRLDVSSGAPVVTASLSTDSSNAYDAEVMPDGRTFALASGAPYEIPTFSVDPLQQFGIVYSTGPYPTAVTATAAGGGLLAAGRNGIYDPDVDVFRLGDPSEHLLNHDLGGTGNTVFPGGLAFSADGTRLFVVSGDAATPTSLSVFEILPPKGSYTPLTPARILDTRFGTGGISGPLGPGATVDVQVTARGGVPEAGVSAVALNVTVTRPSASSFLTIFPAGSARPLASNLNFTPGKTVPNLVVVKVGVGGAVSMFNYLGTTDVIFDVAGWFSTVPRSDGRFTPLTPARILDTRDGTGGGVRLAPGTSLDLQVAGRGGVPASGATAAVVNVAATATTAGSFLTVHPFGEPRPLASTLNFSAGDTVSNRAIVKLGTGGKITVYNQSGSTDVVVDVGGWYGDVAGPGVAGTLTPLVPARILDTRNGTGGVLGPMGAGTSVDVQVTGRGGVPATGVSAVILNATVVDPAAAGFVTISPTAVTPLASDLNYAAGEVRPNLVVVGVGALGTVHLFVSAGTHVIFDVAGWTA